MTKNIPIASRSCLSRGEFTIEHTAQGAFRINVPACSREHCALRMLASDLGQHADKRGLFLTTENVASTELDARAYLAAWRFFAGRILSDSGLGLWATDHRETE